MSETKTDYDLHVLLVMKQDNVAKSKAQFQAWQEGPAGLKARMEMKRPTGKEK
jgi:hypothetical protein